jgi:hypothetical protein
MMLKALTAIMALFTCMAAIADPVICGDAKGHVILKNVTIDGYQEIEATLSFTKKGTKTVHYKVKDADFVGLECTTTQNGMPMFIFQEYCGGSGCRDIDNYGLVDPANMKLLLTPDSDNKSIVKNLLGLEAPPLTKIISINKTQEDFFQKEAK